MKRAIAIKNKASGLTIEDMAVARDEREVRAGRSFDKSVELFIELCTQKVKTYYNPPPTCGWTVRLWSTDSPRYVRIWKKAYVTDSYFFPVSDDGDQIYAFIDKLTGDVLKPASWKAPAKHARGNIFDEDPSASCNFHGPNYLR